MDLELGNIHGTKLDPANVGDCYETWFVGGASSETGSILGPKIGFLEPTTYGGIP